MAKKRSLFFWISFWSISTIFLFGWFLFWRYQHQGYFGLVKVFKPAIKVLPIKQEKRQELNGVLEIADYLSNKGEQEFLLLFQNNHELRPGGGYIGSFGILKFKGERITSIESHNTNVFDSRISTNIKPPYPMEKMLNIKDWELRDSNWSGDFSVNAQKADEFYHLEGGKEKFNGVIAISTEVLKSFLEVVGPIKIAGYPGEYNAENVIEKLQYQVEQGYWKQKIEKGRRKDIMKDISRVIMQRMQKINLKQKKQLAKKIEQHLNNKDIQIYFKDPVLEEKITALNWGGKIKNDTRDYLMVLDANLGSLKSDAVIKRSFEYQVDFRHEKPRAKLILNYQHQGVKADWRTRDYDVYTRVLTPAKSWLYDIKQAGEVRFGKELNKKVFAFIHQVKLGQEKKVILNYDLPKEINESNYSLLIQKQAGLKKIPGKIKIIFSNDKEKNFPINLTNEWRLEKLEIPKDDRVVIKE